MERLLCPVMPSARVAAAVGSGCMTAWPRTMEPRLHLQADPGPRALEDSWSRSTRRLLGHCPGAVVTAVEDVTRREACSRLAEVLQAQPRVAASTQSDCGPLDSVFDAGVAQHDPISFRRRHVV